MSQQLIILVNRDSQGHYIVGSGRKYRELKEINKRKNP